MAALLKRRPEGTFDTFVMGTWQASRFWFRALSLVEPMGMHSVGADWPASDLGGDSTMNTSRCPKVQPDLPASTVDDDLLLN